MSQLQRKNKDCIYSIQ